MTAIAAEEPEDSRPLFGIADVYKRRGEFARAGEARRKAYELERQEDAAQAFARATTEAEYAKAEMAVARAELRDLQSNCAKRRFVSPLDLARLHAQVGNREQALAGLERALTMTSPDFRCSRSTRPGIRCAPTPGLRPSSAGSAFPDRPEPGATCPPYPVLSSGWLRLEAVCACDERSACSW